MGGSGHLTRRHGANHTRSRRPALAATPAIVLPTTAQHTAARAAASKPHRRAGRSDVAVRGRPPARARRGARAELAGHLRRQRTASRRHGSALAQSDRNRLDSVREQTRGMLCAGNRETHRNRAHGHHVGAAQRARRASHGGPVAQLKLHEAALVVVRSGLTRCDITCEPGARWWWWEGRWMCAGEPDGAAQRSRRRQRSGGRRSLSS